MMRIHRNMKRRITPLQSKKGLSFKFLISILILISLVALLIRFSHLTEEIKDTPYGTTQIGVLIMGIQGDNALLGLDTSVELAKAETKKAFNENAGMNFFFEDEENPCGKYFKTNTWYNGEMYCIPPFEENIAKLFNGFLNKHLYQHPAYYYPTFTTTVTANGATTKLTGIADKKLSITGRVGGKKSFTLDNKRFLIPDYEEAIFERPLNYKSREGQKITNIVVHYTAGSSLAEAESTLAQKSYSYHYIIDNSDGKIHQYVLEKDSAQHAGCTLANEGIICLQENMNSKSIGISFVNEGPMKKNKDGSCAGYTSKEAFKGYTCWHKITAEQNESFIKLLTSIVKRNEYLRNSDGSVKKEAILMHSDIKSTKLDPGPAFTDNLQHIIDKVNEELQQAETQTDGSSSELLNPTKEIKSQTKLSSQTTIIGPGPDLCTGNEAPPLKSYTDRIQELAWPTSDKKTYQDIILAAAQEIGVDPALLATHTILETSMGKADNCKQLAKKSSLTGCTWYPSCSKGCACTGPATSSDAAQLLCTAKADFNAFKEMDTGEDIVSGQYTKCSSLPGDKAWTCMMCIYQGNYNSDITNSGQKYFTRDGTCDYAEKLLKQYCSWRSYFESTGLLSDYSLTGGYRTSYEVPLSFEENVDIDLSELLKVKELVKNITTQCTDDTEQCLRKKINYYNKELAERTPQGTEVPYLNIITRLNPFVEEFVSQLTSCNFLQKGSTCQIQANESLYKKDFALEFRDKTLVYLQGRIYDETLSYQEKPRVKGYGTTDPSQKNYQLIFSGRTDSVYIQAEYTDNNAELFPKEALATTKLLYSRDEKGIYLDGTENNIILPAYKASFTIQQGKPDNKGLLFSLLLPEKIPPIIDVHTIQSTYNTTYKRYELIWTPVTTYPDNKAVNDIKEYRIYCSAQEINNNSNPPTEDKLSMTITRKDEGFFPITTYQHISHMSAAIDRCGTEDITTTGNYYIAIIPVDGAGQYNITFKSTKLEDGIQIPMRTAQSLAVAHPEQNNEAYNPPIKCEFGNIPTNMAYGAICQAQKRMQEATQVLGLPTT